MTDEPTADDPTADERRLYEVERNLAEQERLTEQARRWAIDLESQLEQARDELRQVTA